MKRIKIVHIINKLVMGGAELNLVDICRYFDTSKLDITVIVFLKNGILDKKFEQLNGIKFINLNFRSRYNFNIYITLIKLLRKISPNIIHTHLPIAGIYSRLANLFLKKTIFVSTQHSTKYIKNIFHRLDRLSTRLVNDYVIANSYFTKEFLVKHKYISKNKVKIIKLGIDFTNYLYQDNNNEKISVLKKELKIEKKSYIIGYIASFKEQKGHKYFIEVAKLLSISNSNLIFILIGDGVLLDEMIKLTKELNIYEKFRFLGEKNNISDYLEIFDLFLSTSVSESFGLSILEAMLKKVPVISFDTDAISEIIINNINGILVEKYNSDRLSIEIQKFLYDKKKSELFIKNAYNFVRDNFSIEKEVKNLENFYLSLKK